MPKICYQPKTFPADQLRMIDICAQVCVKYAAQGYDLTLRQLYYKVFLDFPEDRKWRWTGTNFVRDPNGTKNAQPNYKWLGDIIADARLAGLLDWDYIVDRTRNLMGNEHWEKPSDLVKLGAERYAIDKWLEQDSYIECWVEKEAMQGIVGRISAQLDIPFFCCRGYTSLSEMWVAGQRLLYRVQEGKQVHIIHLGDHDPSGIDMSRDIKSRLQMFVDAHTQEIGGANIHVLRVALNMPQITRLDLPPSPAKLTDSRAADYVEKYGPDTWELDALEPADLSGIIERAVMQYRDEARWQEAVKNEERGRRTLEAIHEDFGGVVQYLRGEVV